MKQKVVSGIMLTLLSMCTFSFDAGESIIGSESVVLQTFAVDQLYFINATILDVGTSHNMTYSGASVIVYVEVDASWNVIDFASFTVAAFHNGSLIDLTEILIVGSGTMTETFSFVWNTSTVEIGSYLISARAYMDLYVDGYVHIFPIGNIDTEKGYSTIQEAINDASEEDTIYVVSGTYYEAVVVNKTISLIGENRETTIVDCNNTAPHVFEIVTDGAHIETITAKNAVSGSSFPSGFGVYHSTNVTINECISTANSYGIYIYRSFFVTASKNQVSSNDYGVKLQFSRNCTIVGNNIENSVHYGINFDNESSNNTVSNNNIINNTDGMSVLYQSNNNVVINNDLVNNVDGIIFSQSNNNIICHNNFIDNTHNQAVSSQSTNGWDNGCEGNYWSDYNGTDTSTPPDGIGDTYLPWESVDHFPLMNPYWNPTDINHDLKVDIKDLATSSLAFGSYPGHPKWNPHADITGPEYLVPDDKVDIRDLALIAINYGEEHS